MIVLGLDSAGKAASVALLRDGEPLYAASLRAGLTHSETLLPLCAEALRAAGLAPQDVDLYAVNAGPGSFTGLRIGLASVKGLCFPFGTPCAGVSTLESLAFSLPVSGSVLGALDARRGEVYCAAFTMDNGTPSRVCDDHSAKASDLYALAASLPAPLHLMGDGAHLAAAALEGRLPFRLVPSPWRLGSAVGVCRCALAHPELHTQAECLIPDYHRLSQAQRERAQRLGLDPSSLA